MRTLPSHNLLYTHTYVTTYRGSNVFHDQPPVDDYANYWRNVIMGRIAPGVNGEGVFFIITPFGKKKKDGEGRKEKLEEKERIILPRTREIMEELVCGGWINSSLADKEGTFALSSSLPARIWLVPRRNPGAVYSLREIMHANIVKIRLRVRSRPQDSAKERKKDRKRAGVERDER